MSKLTAKQERFVAEYLIDLNATGAATRAGYSAKTAEQQGYRLLRNVQVAAAIEIARAKHAARLEITAERVLRELARIGFSDPRRLYREDGSLKPVPELDDDTAATVAQVEVFEEFEGRGDDRHKIGDTIKIKHWDKANALVNLGKHLKLFPNQNEHSGPNGQPIRFQTIDPSKMTDEQRADVRRAASVIRALEQPGAN